jgi:hypothetical protein
MGILDSGLLRKNLVVFCLLQLIAVIIYFPVLTNNFLADDYRVMNRVGLHGEVIVHGFFRPLSDISLYLNYMMAGFKPLIYYLTNIFFHAWCSFMIFILCGRTDLIPASESDKRVFSWFAALLFLTYPFHNESIAWIVGRASLLATFFGLACLLVATRNGSSKSRYFFAGLFYFIGLLAYESIFPLPAIVILLSWNRYKSISIVIRWIGVFVAGIILHLIMRIYFSGVVTGEYGQEIFSLNIVRYISNFFKIIGRMLLPPTDNSTLLVMAFLVLIISYIASRIIQKIKRKKQSPTSVYENRIIIMFAIALIVPFTFSVSTRTSEGDRLLYFPSVFLCMLFAFVLVTRLNSRSMRLVILGCLLIYNIIFLEINNFHWKKASEITDLVLKQVGTISGKSKDILLFNVPGEYKGAYIFRNALEDALLIKGIDTSIVHPVNYLNHAEDQLLPAKILPVEHNDSIYIGKNVVLSRRTVVVKDVNRPRIPPVIIMLTGKEELWYWDKHNLTRLPPGRY